MPTSGDVTATLGIMTEAAEGVLGLFSNYPLNLFVIIGLAGVVFAMVRGFIK